MSSTGFVKWYDENKGFGFITPDGGGADLYFHSSEIRSDFKLKEYQRVTFDIGNTRKGVVAENVQPA